MAMRRPRRNPKPTGGKPPIRTKPARFKKIGGVKMKFTGKGRRGVGLGLHGKGKAIRKKGYTGKGRFGYGQGHHGAHSGATTPSSSAPRHETQTRPTATRETHRLRKKR